MKDHYQTLGVPENASEQEIKLAYRKLAKRYHPDVNAGAKGAEDRFKEILEAYSVLSDFSARRTYDAKRMGKFLFANNPVFYSQKQKKEKDPRRKEYSEEDLERARNRHKAKVMSHMERRKKILVGMIISFVVFMIASAAFENWVEQKRDRDALALSRRLDSLEKVRDAEQQSKIENADSPYDAFFGEEQYDGESRNRFVIYMAFSDAIICAQQIDPPYKTIRNEFIEAKTGFVMPEMPGGNYSIKLYTGKNWDVNKRIPDGRKLGGFTKNEAYYRIHNTYHLHENNKKDADTTSCDTLFIDPRQLKMDVISSSEFFDSGKK